MREGAEEKIKRLEEWLSRTTYAPGTVLRAASDGLGKFVLQCVRKRHDSNVDLGSPERVAHTGISTAWKTRHLPSKPTRCPIPIQCGEFLPPDAIEDRDAFLCFLRDLCVRLETHEVHEWLRFDGKFITEPHPGVNYIHPARTYANENL